MTTLKWGLRIRRASLVVSVAAIALALMSGVAGAERKQGYELAMWKTKRRMELRYEGALVRDFEIALGRTAVGHKEMQGDKRTPVGRYFVSEKHHSRRFHRFLGLNYPNVDDANRGYETGLISARQWAELFVAEESGEEPPASTGLGGRIGIHGYGHRPYIPVIDWTDGCIAVSNEEAEYLYRTLPVGTQVLIYE